MMVCDAAQYFSHAHTLQHKDSFNDVQAHLYQFHLEVQQVKGVIPIDLETPPAYASNTKLTTKELMYISLVGAPPLVMQR